MPLLHPLHPQCLWFDLLRYQRHSGLTGLTPCFLIGASSSESVANEDAAYHQLCSLFSSFMRDTPTGYQVVIARCLTHGQPIAGLYGTREPKPRSEPVIDSDGTVTALYAERHYFATQQRTVESLTDRLWDTFKSPLVTGDFSFRDDDYCAFDTTDREFIASAQTYAASRARRRKK